MGGITSFIASNKSTTMRVIPALLAVIAVAVADNSGSGYGPHVYPPVNYHYAYEVQEDYTHLNFGQEEGRNGAATSGQYHVLLPDGRTQTVTYNVGDAYTGYVADVKYSGDAKEYKPAPVPAPAYKPTPSYKPLAPVYNKPVVTYKPSDSYNPAPAYKPAPTYNPAPVYKPVPVYKPAPVYTPAPTYKPAATTEKHTTQHEYKSIYREHIGNRKFHKKEKDDSLADE